MSCLFPDDLGDDGRLDVDVHLCKVLARVDVDGVEEAVLDRGLQSKKQFHFNMSDTEHDSEVNWVFTDMKEGCFKRRLE